MSCIRRALTESLNGLSNSSQDLILHSWKPNTCKQYEIHLKKWDNYCSRINVSPQFTSITDGLNFLSECYDNGYSYSALNTARSALSTVIMLPSTNTFGLHPLVVRLMKGVFNKRPSLPKYATTWDINIVLRYLEQLPLKSITFKQLSLKTVMLLSLLSGQRLQTLKSIKVENVNFTHEGCEIYIDTLLKTTKPGKHLKPIKLQKYDADNLCIVSHLKEYVSVTDSLRTNEDQLFIRLQKPYVGVSTDTIARWLKLVMSEAGIDVTVFSAHSTRSAATSKANSCQVPIDTILAAGGWTNAQTFAKYYNKPIPTSSFGNQLLRNKDCEPQTS